MRPAWVSPTAEPVVHFDQFLHAYYYVKVRDDGVRVLRKEETEEDDRKSARLVEIAFQKNRANPAAALREAAEWWASLDSAPYGEDSFIAATAPRLRSMFDRPRLAAWTLNDFQNVFYDVHAFKTHARQVKNSFFGLPASHKEPGRQRSDRLAAWIWNQHRELDQKSLLEMLDFLVWGSNPSDMVDRLWIVLDDKRWHFDRLGKSSLGEAVGWARPDVFPPRNNRTNKALRSLGHDVELFSV